jgi:hypothetical protein
MRDLITIRSTAYKFFGLTRFEWALTSAPLFIYVHFMNSTSSNLLILAIHSVFIYFYSKIIKNFEEDIFEIITSFFRLPNKAAGLIYVMTHSRSES